MLSSEARNQILFGLSRDVSDDVKGVLSKGIDDVTKYFNDLRDNTSSNTLYSTKNKNAGFGQGGTGVYNDNAFYTNLADMINGDNRFVEECGDMLEALYSKNRKYYSIIKDYQVMDILIPQINRVMMFLVNECISPDIQNNRTFDIKYNSKDNRENITKEIASIRDELGLDPLLRKVYINRIKLGRDYYQVIDYNETYEQAEKILKRAKLNESVESLTEAFDQVLEPLTVEVDNISFSINETCYQEDKVTDSTNGDKAGPTNTDVPITIENLNIQIERSPAVGMIKDARDSIFAETASSYSVSSVFNTLSNGSLNEAATVIDNEQLTLVLNNLKKKKIDRCLIRRLDPAKVFKLTAAGRTIGYFYVEELEAAKQKSINVAQALKDRLLKARVTNMNQSFSDAEDIISKQLAEKIIKTFDPNIGISRIEDIDLLQNYIVSSGIVNGNKKITFYYKDDIFDMSREDDSMLTNAVLFTKLYSTLMLNNIMTKILRGRGRQIHTVNMGVSPMAKKYVINAMAALTMPENNLGTLHGSFEQLLNPLNSASDIVIPSEDDSTRYIQTDYIEGQNVDMDTDFLKFLLNSIVSSFGLDPAVLDATNGNVQFAKTLTMESVQICIMIMNEQNELIHSWKKFVLRCLSIEGSDQLKSAIASGLVDVKFFAPKSLTLQMSVDEINNAKTHAEAIADIIPLFNAVDGPEIDAMRSEFVFSNVVNNANIDWENVSIIQNDAEISSIDLDLQKQIIETIRAYKENTQTRDIDTMTNEDLQDDTMSTTDNVSEEDMAELSQLSDEDL